MGVLIRELSVLYGAFVRGEADPLPELSLQYADYAVWQRKWIEGDILRQQARVLEDGPGGCAGGAGDTWGPCASGAAGLCRRLRGVGAG